MGNAITYIHVVNPNTVKLKRKKQYIYLRLKLNSLNLKSKCLYERRFARHVMNQINMFIIDKIRITQNRIIKKEQDNLYVVGDLFVKNKSLTNFLLVNNFGWLKNANLDFKQRCLHL